MYIAVISSQRPKIIGMDYSRIEYMSNFIYIYIYIYIERERERERARKRERRGESEGERH